MGARAGAVDFVRHQQLGEDWALDEAELFFAVVAFLQHFGAENIGGHEVGGELDAAVIEPQNLAEGGDQARLGDAGHPDEQDVAAGEHGGEALADDVILAEDRFLQLGFGIVHFGAGLLQLIDQFRVAGVGDGGGGDGHGGSFDNSAAAYQAAAGTEREK